jgi:hypothetical protein
VEGIDPSLPGADLVEQGLDDLRCGRETVASMLVAQGAERLRELGIEVPIDVPDAHLRMYALLSAELGDGAHSRYNALRRRLVSFLRAKACVK